MVPYKYQLHPTISRPRTVLFPSRNHSRCFATRISYLEVRFRNIGDSQSEMSEPHSFGRCRIRPRINKKPMCLEPRKLLRPETLVKPFPRPRQIYYRDVQRGQGLPLVRIRRFLAGSQGFPQLDQDRRLVQLQ